MLVLLAVLLVLVLVVLVVLLVLVVLVLVVLVLVGLPIHRTTQLPGKITSKTSLLAKLVNSDVSRANSDVIITKCLVPGWKKLVLGIMKPPELVLGIDPQN